MNKIIAYFSFIFIIISIFSCKKQTEYDNDFVRERLDQEVYGSSEWHEVLDSVINKYPDEAFPYYRKGLQLMGDNYPEGMKLMEHAAELDPYMYANYLGYIKLSSFRDYEASIEHFKTAIEYNNHIDIIVPGSAYERMGIAYKEMENSEKAITLFASGKNAPKPITTKESSTTKKVITHWLASNSKRHYCIKTIFAAIQAVRISTNFMWRILRKCLI